MSEQFNLDLIDKTFTTYKKGQTFEGVVVLKRADGVIFNIGGKNDAFIPASDFDSFDDVKIGDRFSVIITKQKNEEGLIEASMRLARDLKIANQNAESLRLGSKFTFVVTSVNNAGLHSKMGDYSVFVPAGDASMRYVRDLKSFVGKQVEVIVTEIDHEKKDIVASAKLLQEQVKVATENNFWNSIFVNKVVTGKVTKIMPYGAFVEVDGVDCFLHISNISYDRLENVGDAIKEGETYSFKVVSLDRENKKVSLGYKKAEDNPWEILRNQYPVGTVCDATIVGMTTFGAFAKILPGIDGLIHISQIADRRIEKPQDVLKVGETVKVKITDIDFEKKRVSQSRCRLREEACFSLHPRAPRRAGF